MKVGEIIDDVCCYYGIYHSFYEVVRVSESGKTVWLRPIDYYRSYGANNWETGKLPRPGVYVGEKVLRRKVHENGGVNISRYGIAEPMGEPHWVCDYNYT